MKINENDPFGLVRSGVLSVCLFFFLLIVLTHLRGGTIVDVVAMPGWVIKVANTAFSVSVLAFLVLVASFNLLDGVNDVREENVATVDALGVSAGKDNRVFFVIWENHQTPVYLSDGVDFDVAMLMSKGYSRNDLVSMGLSGTQYNKFSSWLKKRGVGGEYKVIKG